MRETEQVIMFEVADPPRNGRMAFADPAGDGELTVVTAPGDTLQTIKVVRMSIADALPVLLKDRQGSFWGAAAAAEEVLAELRDRNVTAAPAPVRGMDAREAFAAAVAPLPPPPPVPGPVPAPWIDGPAGLDPEVLTELVEAAATRARYLLGREYDVRHI